MKNQHNREACRLTVAAGLAERKLEAELQQHAAWLRDQEARRREKIRQQMDIDHLFEAINRDNHKRADAARPAVDVDYEPVQAVKCNPMPRPRVIPDWMEFICLTIFAAGLVVTRFV